MAEKISQTGHMYATTVPSMDGDCWREEPTNAKPAVTVAEILRLCLLINGDHSVMDVHRVRDRILLGPWGRDRVRADLLSLGWVRSPPPGASGCTRSLICQWPGHNAQPLWLASFLRTIISARPTPTPAATSLCSTDRPVV